MRYTSAYKDYLHQFQIVLSYVFIVNKTEPLIIILSGCELIEFVTMHFYPSIMCFQVLSQFDIG